MKSQSEKILRAFERGEVLTPMKALKRFGCFRLAARVFDLRRDGHDIRCQLLERAGKKVGHYYLAA